MYKKVTISFQLYDTVSRISPPKDIRRVRIDGGLKSIGDTVTIKNIGAKGTITDILFNQTRGIYVLVFVHNYELRIKSIPIEELGDGVGICDFYRSWMNHLGIYFYDRVLVRNPSEIYREGFYEGK